MKDLLITLLNTAFWGRTAFRYGWRILCSAEGRADAVVRPKPAFFTVSDWNAGLRDHRNGRTGCRSLIPNLTSGALSNPADTAYLDCFLFNTCRAEVIHYVIGVLGWVSLVFCLLSADRWTGMAHPVCGQQYGDSAGEPAVRMDSAV